MIIQDLRPTTLATIVADLLNQKAELGIDQNTSRFCEQAYNQGMALVGKDTFDEMVRDSVEEQ